MKKSILVFIAVFISCRSNKIPKNEIQLIKKDLEQILEIDQLCAMNVNAPEKLKHFSQEKWDLYKDSVFKNNREKAERYLDKYGYLGIKEVGKHASVVFWLIAQHSDKDVSFQEKVLEKLKLQVDKKNARPQDYAYLYDRVKLNKNEKQLYATQVEYNDKGQATPKKLEDSINIDKRRLAYKLGSLKEYLNLMTKNHFEMNKDLFVKKGILEPNLYE
jgi:hypothetical protein